MSLALLAWAQPTLAHGYIVRSIPEDRAVLARAPTRLQYWFSENLEPEFSSLTVYDQEGTVIATGGVADDDLSLLTVHLPSGLPDGAYIAALHVAFSSDGHVADESRVFFVGQSIAGVSGSAATSQANPLEVLWRTVTLTAALVLFGTFALYSNALVPAWGNLKHNAGLLPPRVMARLNWIVIAALALLFAGNLLALLQQAMAFFNASAPQVISQGYWNIVRIGTRFGDVWNVRMLLLLLVAMLHGLSIYYREQFPETVRPFWTANTWAMALLLGTFSAASHAAGSLLWPWAAVAVDWLHLLAVGFWAGGLIALVLALPAALRPYEGDTRRVALLAALTRFSRIALLSVGVVIATGVYSALNWLSSPTDATQTSYGGALIVKLILVAGLLLVGLAHHVALRPARYWRWSALIERVDQFSGSLRLEALLVVPVLVSVALLSATPVPVPDVKAPAPPTATQQVGELTVTQTISPGGPGVNTYDTLVTREGQAVDGLKVRLRIAYPALDRRSAWQEAENADAGLYVTAGDEIDRVGNWWTLVDIYDCPDTAVCAPTRAAFNWTISDDAAVLRSRNPGVLNLLALAGIAAAVGRVLYSPARQIYGRLDLSPMTVTVALGATVATALFVVVAVAMTQNAQAQYEASLNPTPQVVNTVLPDAASLERGQALYNADCVNWTSAPEALNALKERLARTRDEELFTATRDGWRGLPPCDGNLSDEQRWDIVNYVRMFEEQ